MRLAFIIIIAGALVQILTSVYWQNIPNKKLGEAVFMCGQAVGEGCYFIAFRWLFKAFGPGVALAEFLLSLVLMDLFTIIFLNPYEVSLPKYLGFVFATVVLLVRWKTHKYDSKTVN